ncbi:MAG: hypothetical protein N3G22_04160 [Candidatus Micrarchaeota archaeon]|nr:hypothetical protein [Candidatus Micrarchaeota archaeon]
MANGVVKNQAKKEVEKGGGAEKDKAPEKNKMWRVRPLLAALWTSAVLGAAPLNQGCGDKIVNNYYQYKEDEQKGVDTTAYLLLSKGKISIGEVLDAGAFKVRLDDIGLQNENGKYPAIISILNISDQVMERAVIAPQKSYTFGIGPSATRTTYLIYVAETAVGYTLNAKWANIETYVKKN